MVCFASRYEQNYPLNLVLFSYLIVIRNLLKKNQNNLNIVIINKIHNSFTT